jgi:hypothetical protein
VDPEKPVELEALEKWLIHIAWIIMNCAAKIISI